MFIQPAAPLPLHEASALVIEGNPQSRSILVAQLRELGLGNVVQCSRLHDARRKLEAARFDVVVCEQEFDRDSSSGQELLDDLRRNQILPFYTVFIMLTAEATYSKVAEAAESALDAYLLKPHTAARLHERILQARQRKRALQDIFSAIDRQDFDTASQLCLQRFETRQPYWLYAARIGAELMLRSGHLGEAQKLYEAVVEAKTLPWAKLGVARAQVEAGYPQRAVTTLESLIETDPGYTDAYDVMGRAQFEMGNFQNALATFKMSTQLTPASVNRLLKHGMMAWYAGEREEGIELLDRATRLGLDSKLFDPQALVLLAFARLDNNDHKGLQRCREQMERIRDRYPDNPRPLLLFRPEPVGADERDPMPPARFRWRRRDLATRANGVLYMPLITEAGFFIGGAYGRGALRIRDVTVDYYSSAKATIGLQIGAQQYAHALFFMTDAALGDFRAASGWAASADIKYATPEQGASIGKETTELDPVVALVFGQQGLIAGATLSGVKP